MLKNLVPNKRKLQRKPQSPKKIKSILTNELIEQKSYDFVSLVGYVILGLIFFDYLHLLIPPQFFNPNWEMEIIGRIVETNWILLLGFLLVFFRTQQKPIKLTEIKILACLSWLSLLIAIGCFVTAPLLISDAIRINQTDKAQFNAQLTNQNTQVEQVFTKIEKASDQELNAALKNNQSQLSSDATQNIKQQLKKTIQQRQQVANEQLRQVLRNKQVKLFKITLKWLLGTIISGIAFVTVWRYTSWTRNIKV